MPNYARLSFLVLQLLSSTLVPRTPNMLSIKIFKPELLNNWTVFLQFQALFYMRKSVMDTKVPRRGTSIESDSYRLKPFGVHLIVWWLGKGPKYTRYPASGVCQGRPFILEQES